MALRASELNEMPSCLPWPALMAYGVGEFDLPFVAKLFAPVAVLWHAPDADRV